MSDSRPVATPSQTVGPFFHFGLTPDTSLGTVRPCPSGDPIRLRIVVTDGDRQPVPDAVVEIWQPASAEFAFGRLATDAAGACEFHTARTPHVNVCLFARGLLRQVHTRIYLARDPAAVQDAVLALVPGERRSTLFAKQDEGHSDRWTFHLRLQGDNETVFLDV